MDNMPQWMRDQIREAAKQRRLSEGLNTWGGKREGSGRKKQYNRLTIVVKFNRIQRLNLEELGEGDVEKGVQALIDKHV